MRLRISILIILMAVSYLLSMLGFLGIGIIIDDHYVFASKEARKQMDKKAYYRQSGIVFLGIGTMFLMYLLRLFLGVGYFTYIAYGIAFAAIIYVIISHYAIRKRQSQNV